MNYHKNVEGSIQEEKCAFSWARASFPIVFAVLAFVCFVLVYLLLTVKSFNPLYLAGLIFILPSIILGSIAISAGKNKISHITSIILTLAIAVLSVVLSFFLVLIISFFQSSVPITNANRYERTMRLANSPHEQHLAIFPSSIPKKSSDASFYYEESVWLEYSQTVLLQLTTDAQSIKDYMKRFEQFVIDKTEDTNKNLFERVGTKYINELNPEYNLYIFLNEGDHNRKVSAAAISQEQNIIIFYAYVLRW